VEKKKKEEEGKKNYPAREVAVNFGEATKYSDYFGSYCVIK